MRSVIIFLISMSVAFVLIAVPVQASSIQEFFTQGQTYYDHGDYKKAVEMFEKVVELDQNFAPGYNALGLAHMAMGDPISEVTWFFKVAVDIDSKYTDAYNNMCRAYSQGKDYDLAEQSCLKALALNPNLSQAQLSLGWVYLLGKANPTEALHYFEEVRKKIESPNIYFGMGMAYSMQGDNARVLEMVTTLRTMGANDLASQLEKSIRKNESPPASPSPVEPASPQSQPSTLIPGATVEKPPAANQEDFSPVSGQMRIRLRGTMQNLPSASAEPSKKHPGSL